MSLFGTVVGTYGNHTGASSAAEGCKECPAGYYCPDNPLPTMNYPSGSLICPKVKLYKQYIYTIMQTQ